MTTQPIYPTYYVRHPDGSYSIAEPQPTQDQIAAQVGFTYAQCDRLHAGGVCADPDCHVAARTSSPVAATQAELVAAGNALYDAIGEWEKPETGFLTPALMRAGEAWCAAIAKAAAPPTTAPEPEEKKT